MAPASPLKQVVPCPQSVPCVPSVPLVVLQPPLPPFTHSTVVARQNHQSVFPEPHLLEHASQVLQLVVQEVYHGVVHAAIVVGDVREPFLGT